MLTNWLQDKENRVGVYPSWASKGVRALFSFRHHPAASAAGLDVAFSERIPLETTLANRRHVAEMLGSSLDSFVFLRQVHGSEVAVVDERHRGMGALSPDAQRLAADAVITNAREVPLAILVADCVPVLFYDPVQAVIGAAHSGWRGTVAHISARVIAAMQQHYGTQPEDVYVSIGPSIRRCCYEVDQVVAGPVQAEFDGKGMFRRFGRADRYLFGMQQAIRGDLERMGVRADAIEDTGICTSCRVNHLFSHRREAGQAGRQMAAIVLT